MGFYDNRSHCCFKVSFALCINNIWFFSIFNFKHFFNRVYLLLPESLCERELSRIVFIRRQITTCRPELFSGRGYWQELIESIVWAHNKLKVAPNIQPRALSITQGRAVGVAHYLLGGIATTWSFFLAHCES